MNRVLFALTALFLASQPALSGAPSSVFTDIDRDRDCAVFSYNEEGGEFANLVCKGWQGYPVLIFSGDLREALFYGFPGYGDFRWESFTAFNSSGPKIEWRIETAEATAVPFATIHRWFVSDDPDNPDRKTQVLVVSKVGQVEEREGCVVGLVLATGNEGANEAARKIADESARDFRCGSDTPTMIGAVPPFSRAD